MERQSLIYSFVACGSFVLTYCSQFRGNFSSIAAQCLQKLPPENNKFNYACDQHTLKYLFEDDCTCMVVADEDICSQMPFAFLERVKDDFKR
ncbi:hypothetical protein KP509_23G009500 [Ceratopteris richardii]|uniref:Longin domain-containing protein n=1 Tax=Ceratopteris richardii TaxID=49495 RepID=A0A8T2S060_CERRI|nr:hypothetical protein KP509_23G009500 [Ceratopteris richardii]